MLVSGVANDTKEGGSANSRLKISVFICVMDFIDECKVVCSCSRDLSYSLWS